MKLEKTSHISVMKEEAIKFLKASDGGVFLDCTLGGAGHTKAILDSNKENKVFAIDRDSFAIERAKEFLKSEESRVCFYNTEFSNISSLFKDEKFDGVLVDLGLSTDQLKEERGFSFNDENSLDMRMNQSGKLTAYSVVNETNYKELFIILKKGGVGKEARAVANAIIKDRPINSAKQLATVIRSTTYKVLKNKKLHPESVSFQAIRIAVNDEFEEISKLLAFIPNVIKPFGRLVVISFHSLEDKIVTSTMRKWQKGEQDFQELKLIGIANKGNGVLLTKKALVPSKEEIAKNFASRSSLMRVFEFN